MSLTSDRAAPSRTPGDLLLHPAALTALALVILNDRVFKARYPGVITGKLSDFAGLVYFPLFVVACLEGLRWLVRRRTWELTSRAVLMAVIVVGVVFALIKTWHPAGDLYRPAIGIVLWPVLAAGDLIRGGQLPGLHRVSLVEDRTDLVALVALWVPLWVSRQVMADGSNSGANPQPETGSTPG